MKRIKILLTYTFAGMISCANMSANGTTLEPFKGCCKISGAPCQTNNDCGTMNRDSCGTCSGLIPDPIEPVDPACIDPKVYDSSSGNCVCPQKLQGLEPACENGHFDDTICTCSCNAGYYQNGDACIKCPDNGTSVAGATSITQCYVTTFSDATGSGTYTSNCYYTK